MVVLAASDGTELYRTTTSAFPLNMNVAGITGAEDGSAGEEQIATKNIGKEYIKCPSQLDAYNKLKAGTLDVIVIDSVMANYYISLEK